ncbi:MAG: phosphatidylserine decarboxylase family protein [Calditrichaceae bacterium]
MTKDGYSIVIYTGLALIGFMIISVFSASIIAYVITGLIGAVFIFHFFFFRDPEREIPEGKNLILSPADGTVLKVDEVVENEYFQEKVRRVCIFLSVFNVHVNRIPIAGEIDHLSYKEGKYLLAFADGASDYNEQSVIGIKTAQGRLLFKQIAGLIARRIVYRINKGDQVNAGDRFGMIKYGSRVDMFFPLSVKIHVKPKDKVKGGSTIIGEF